MTQSTNLSSRFPFSVITGPTINRIIASDFPGCVKAVREGYLAHASGRSSTPISVFLRFADRPNARIIGLPTHLGGPDALSGIKWIGSYPDNVEKGFPRASAVIVLNSHEHGYPFACLEGSIISAARTAASAALAAGELNTTRRARKLGIVGAGFIARYVHRFLLGTGWEIDRVCVHDLLPDRAGAFAAELAEESGHCKIETTDDIGSLLRSSDLILFATVAPRPHVHDPALFAHCPLVLHVSLRDLAPAIILQAWNLTDDIDHVLQAETSPHLAEMMTGARDHMNGTLSDLMLGGCAVDRSRPMIFSPFGLGVLDLVVGKWVYECAAAANERILVDNFFHDV